MKNSKKSFVTLVFIVVIALLVIGGGVYIYGNKKTETSTLTDLNAQKTYTNIKYGFSFQYPSTWFEDNSSEKYVTFRIGADDSSKYGECGTNRVNFFWDTSIDTSQLVKQVSIGVINFKEDTVNENEMCGLTYREFISVGLPIQFKASTVDKVANVNDLISVLRTFKFTK